MTDTQIRSSVYKSRRPRSRWSGAWYAAAEPVVGCVVRGGGGFGDGGFYFGGRDRGPVDDIKKGDR